MVRWQLKTSNILVWRNRTSEPDTNNKIQYYDKGKTLNYSDKDRDRIQNYDKEINQGKVRDKDIKSKFKGTIVIIIL